MIEDDKFAIMAEDIDGFLAELGNTYKMSLITVSAVVLARLTVAAKTYKIEDELIQIMNRARLQLAEKNEETQVH